MTAGSDTPGPLEGSGAEAAPYRISNEEDLALLAGVVSYGTSFYGKSFVLTADIGNDATPVTTVIGDDEYAFCGNFDGAGHTVKLTIDEPDARNVGLFGQLGGEIKNLTVAGTVEGSQYVGGVWYTEAIRWAASEGLVKGYIDGTYQPDKDITRDELATILYRYAQKKGEGFTGSRMFLLPFEDRMDIGAWAETAAMVQRFCEALEKQTEKSSSHSKKASRALPGWLLRMRFFGNVPNIGAPNGAPGRRALRGYACSPKTVRDSVRPAGTPGTAFPTEDFPFSPMCLRKIGEPYCRAYESPRGAGCSPGAVSPLSSSGLGLMIGILLDGRHFAVGLRHELLEHIVKRLLLRLGGRSRILRSGGSGGIALPGSEIACRLAGGRKGALDGQIDLRAVDADDHDLHILPFGQEIMDIVDKCVRDFGDMYHAGLSLRQRDECAELGHALDFAFYNGPNC